MGRGTGTTSLEINLIKKLTEMGEAFLHKIFLDLQNAYDALDRDRCIGIPEVYGMGSQAIWVFRTYWGRLTMVSKARGYRGPPFNSFHGVTQGKHLSPTLFNFVADVIMRHWVIVVT